MRRSPRGSPASTWVLLLAPLAAVCAAAACGNGGGPPHELGGGDDGGGVDATGDVLADAPGDARTGEAGGDGGGGGDAAKDAADASNDGPAPEAEAGVPCTLKLSWGAPTSVLTTAPADATIFGGVTPDELTIAWTSAANGVVTAWYADRAKVTDPFGAPRSLDPKFGVLGTDRISVSGDGLRIVGVRSDYKGFVAALRSSRANAFDTDDSPEFAALNSTMEMNPTLFGSPLLAVSNHFFYYLDISIQTGSAFYESPGGPPWGMGAALKGMQLAASNGDYRRPSGTTSDDLAMFYWDETTATEKVAQRAMASQPYSTFTDIGVLTNAAPTASCTRIYYSVAAPDAGAGAITIVYADAM